MRKRERQAVVARESAAGRVASVEVAAARKGAARAAGEAESVLSTTGRSGPGADCHLLGLVLVCVSRNRHHFLQNSGSLMLLLCLYVLPAQAVLVVSGEVKAV